MIQSWLSAWAVRDFISHSLHSRRGCVICNRRHVYLALRRKGLVIDLTEEDIFGYVQRVLTSAEVLFFSPENSTIASGEVNTILFMTVRAFQ